MDIIKKKPSNGLHPWVPELQDQLRKGQISRREFLRYATLLGVSVSGATVLAACGAQPTPAPTAAPAAAARRGPPTAVPAADGGSCRDRGPESRGRPAARRHADHRVACPAHRPPGPPVVD